MLDKRVHRRYENPDYSAHLINTNFVECVGGRVMIISLVLQLAFLLGLF